jgi:DNA polymerase V
MGAPWFQIRKFLEQENVFVLSSNYALYADMSSRLMSILRRFSPVQEVYSIDESFLDLTGFTHVDLTEYALTLRQTVLQGTDLPVSVGIGTSFYNLLNLVDFSRQCLGHRPGSSQAYAG